MKFTYRQVFILHLYLIYRPAYCNIVDGLDIRRYLYKTVSIENILKICIEYSLTLHHIYIRKNYS